MVRCSGTLPLFLVVQNAFADDLAALTDTNGNFTWPPHINASQITGWSNTITFISTNGGSATLNPDGHFRFVDSNGMVVAFAPQSFTAMETNGNGFTYSNGMFYLNGETFFQSVVIAANSTSNQMSSVTNLQNAINALSNQIFLSFSASNAVTLAALSGTNTLIHNALIATNTTLLAAIATNGVNSTNFEYALAYGNTNFTIYSVSNSGAQLTNFAYFIGQNATNYANLVAAAGTNNTSASTNSTFAIVTNFFAAHTYSAFVTVPAGVWNTMVSVPAGFLPTDFHVVADHSDGNTTPFTLSFGGSGIFYITVSDTNVAKYFQYILHHP